MGIISKLDMFLLAEAVVKLTPYGASFVKFQDIFDKDELAGIISKMESNAGKDMKYEVSFGKGGNKDKLLVYRKDLTKSEMSKDTIKAFENEIKGLIKGTGLKISGDTNVTKWAAMYLSK